MTDDEGAGRNRLSAAEAARRIEAGEISSEELVGDCLARIAAREADVGAWAYIDPEYALVQARTCDSRPRLGPLPGVPVGIKDVFDTSDMPTEYGSPIHKGHRPASDSALVTALRASGMVIMGKTVTTEFASPVAAGTRNPLDLSRTSGVSSMGSAAAVADFMVHGSAGTQTGGSVIRPASYCGVYGYKASLDGLDRAGLRHCRAHLDTAGLFARSIEDIALLRAAACNTAPAAPWPDGQPAPRIGICHTRRWEQAGDAVSEALEDAAKRLSLAGATVGEAELPDDFEDFQFTFRSISSVEGLTILAEEAREHPDMLNEWIRGNIEIGQSRKENDYQPALLEAERLRQIVDRLFESADVLLSVSAEDEATKIDEDTPIGSQAFNGEWTLMHTPSINLPHYTGPNGLPLGLQLIGRRGADDALISAAYWVADRLG